MIATDEILSVPKFSYLDKIKVLDGQSSIVRATGQFFSQSFLATTDGRAPIHMFSEANKM